MKIPINILVGLFLIISLSIFNCKPSENKFKSLLDDDEIATLTSDNETELLEAIKILNKNGGTIYIDTPIINMDEYSLLTISGTLSGGIIGIRQSNGEYPRINFVHSNKTRETSSGVMIKGSNKFIEYMIFENSFKYGIEVVGSNNILDHVVSRYNYGPGFLIRGSFNSFNYCYSYRNCDTNIFSINGDGFKINGELNNVFSYCFAWDNGNSGFHYTRLSNSSDLSYVHSGSWNNGNVDVFTGKYDYDNGSPLDKNLWTIRDMILSDENFVGNYYNKKYNIDEAKIDQYTVEEWINHVNPRMDGDGFTFGSLNNTQNIDVKRNSFYNVAFDHKSGGFIDKYDHRYNAFVTDCVSFNNGINYRLTYALTKWSNNWSWNSNIKDQFKEDVILKKPRNQNAAQRQFYVIRDKIKQAVFANMFPDNVNFDAAIQELKE